MSIFRENPKNRRHLNVRLLWPVLSVFSLAIAQTQNSSEQEIAQAREKYHQGEFEAAIEMLNRCMRQGDLTEAQKQQVHQGLAQAYLAKDYLDEAAIFSSSRIAFARIITLYAIAFTKFPTALINSISPSCRRLAWRF